MANSKLQEIASSILSGKFGVEMLVHMPQKKTARLSIKRHENTNCLYVQDAANPKSSFYIKLGSVTVLDDDQAITRRESLLRESFKKVALNADLPRKEIRSTLQKTRKIAGVTSKAQQNIQKRPPLHDFKGISPLGEDWKNPFIRHETLNIKKPQTTKSTRGAPTPPPEKIMATLEKARNSHIKSAKTIKEHKEKYLPRKPITPPKDPQPAQSLRQKTNTRSPAPGSTEEKNQEARERAAKRIREYRGRTQSAEKTSSSIKETKRFKDFPQIADRRTVAPLPTPKRERPLQRLIPPPPLSSRNPRTKNISLRRGVISKLQKEHGLKQKPLK